MALRTEVFVHPDERLHVDAFRYFETHWWPPDLDSDAVSYSVSGWSRVYTSEVVYIIYGKLGAFISAIDPPIRTLLLALHRDEQVELHGEDRIYLPLVTRVVGYKVVLYRLLNVALYLITLLITFSVGRRHFWINSIGLVLICLPQVTYVYSYANSDAWGLSLSLFLFYAVVTASNLRSMTLGRVLVLGVLTGLLLLSKQSFWISLFFSYAPMAYRAVMALYTEGVSVLRALMSRAMLLLGIASMIALPLSVVYPLTQGDFAARKEQMMDARSSGARKLSDPQGGYRLAAQGVSPVQVVSDPLWWELSLKSLYGLFGYMNVYLPGYLYKGVLALVGVLIAVSLGFALSHWKEVPTLRRLLWVSAPPTLLLVLASSLYYSWVTDWQPQGRYLFVALLPVGIMAGGNPHLEPGWIHRFRISIWGLLIVLSLYVLWTVMLTNPQLSAATLHLF
jgi:hypothetical protein